MDDKLVATGPSLSQKLKEHVVLEEVVCADVSSLGGKSFQRGPHAGPSLGEGFGKPPVPTEDFTTPFRSFPSIRFLKQVLQHRTTVAVRDQHVRARQKPTDGQSLHNISYARHGRGKPCCWQQALCLMGNQHLECRIAFAIGDRANRFRN